MTWYYLQVFVGFLVFDGEMQFNVIAKKNTLNQLPLVEIKSRGYVMGA